MNAPLKAAGSLLILLATAERAAAAGVVVRTFDLVGLTGEETSVAQRTAGTILRQAGLAIDWRDCSGGCAAEPAARHIVLRIASAPTSATAGSLGYSVVDTVAESGTLATVFADRIASAAVRTRVAMSVLLGRAIAHEIGHLLLGTSQHSATGLMRALWSDRELRRDAAHDWMLSPEVVAELARREEARDR